MKSEFKVKYLQHLVRKNKDNQGFTLIELLVVIIIVGVLAAIALPSFLNQIGKARGSEAKSSLGVMNRSQQAYRLENGTFAGTTALLDAKISPKFYAYTMTSASANTAQIDSAPIASQTSIKDYSAAVQQNQNDTFGQTLCESLDVSGATANNTATATAGSTAGAGAPGTCSASSKPVQ
jgi:type IV pilus assembly protein PilA